MSENPVRLQYLFERYAAGKAGAAELEEFWQLLGSLDDNDILPEAMQVWWNRYEGDFDLSGQADGEGMLKKIRNAPQHKEADYLKNYKKSWGRWYRWTAAAVWIVAVSIGVYIYLKPVKQDVFPAARVTNPAYKNDVLPGVTGATLTLADGSIIALDSAANQLPAQQGDVQVTARNGTLNYNGTGSHHAAVYNTLTTSPGQQFPVRLSDGTLVVLDAGSSLTYPVAFTGTERRVQVNGQAWFEVAKNPAKPFIVQKGSAEVQVLGTQFNVNAYDDEPNVKVTLVQGSIKVNNGALSNRLIPGQQAVLYTAHSGIKVVKDADIDQAVAWKNGQFEFRSNSITQVLREAARWYNIEVVYEGDKPADTFTGGIHRSATLTELLTILEMSKVHFRLQGRKLTVLSQ